MTTYVPPKGHKRFMIIVKLEEGMAVRVKKGKMPKSRVYAWTREMDHMKGKAATVQKVVDENHCTLKEFTGYIFCKEWLQERVVVY